MLWPLSLFALYTVFTVWVAFLGGAEWLADSPWIAPFFTARTAQAFVVFAWLAQAATLALLVAE